MKIEPRSTDYCPHCGVRVSFVGNTNPTVAATAAMIGTTMATCKECGERWGMGDLSWLIGKSVTVRKRNSCWDGETGRIEQIISPTLVRVKFALNRRENGGDIFHPAYLDDGVKVVKAPEPEDMW